MPVIQFLANKPTADLGYDLEGIPTPRQADSTSPRGGFWHLIGFAGGRLFGRGRGLSKLISVPSFIVWKKGVGGTGWSRG